MRPPDPAPVPVDASLVGRLTAIAAEHGITHVGVAPAEPLLRARAELHRRRELNLHDGMSFTYRNIERSTDPAQAVRDARSIVVGARPYFDDDVEPVARPAGRVARYSWADHYAPLREGLWAVATQLRSLGYRAVPFADDNSIVDREVAHLAGLGWFGKNANLLLPGAGSWFVLGCVITDAPLPVAEQVVPDGCGACHRCIDRCPTAAIVADGVIDAGRCLAWLLQKPGIVEHRWRAAIGDRIYGCDECQLACPPSMRPSIDNRAPDDVTSASARQPWIDVLALLEGDDDEVMDVWGRRYLADRDPRWVRRNALIVLGNVGDATDRRVADTVLRYLAHPDAVLRAHAVWVAQSLGMHDMLPATDPDPDVLAELARV